MPAPTHESYLATPRFSSLDGLRCLAVLPVIWHHSTPRPPSGLLGRGPLGVDLFFAISGFLITTLLLRERRARGAVSVGRFYARRALRIFPAYYLVLGLYALRAWFLMASGPSRDHFLRSLPYWATYTANWFVDFDIAAPVVFAFGWSLATEEQFYAVWPWLARMPRWVMPVAAALLLGADQSVELGLVGVSWPAIVRRVVAGIASPICMGALLACALDGAAAFRASATWLGRRASAPVIATALLVLIALPQAPLVFIEGAMALLVAACCLRRDHGLAAVLDTPLLRWVGTISYALYLVHVSAITCAKLLAPSRASDAPFVFVVGLGIALPLAWGLHTAIDAPLHPLRARLRVAGEPEAHVSPADGRATRA